MERILFVSSVRYDKRCALVTLLFACLDGWNICCLLSLMVGIFVVCLVRWLEYLLSAWLDDWDFDALLTAVKLVSAWLDGWNIGCLLGEMVVSLIRRLFSL